MPANESENWPPINATELLERLPRFLCLTVLARRAGDDHAPTRSREPIRARLAPDRGVLGHFPR